MGGFFSRASMRFDKRASFVELFFDLIFVFCVGKCIGLAVEDGSVTLYGWGVFLFCFLCSLEIWALVTFMLCRFRSGSRFESLGQFACMFFMYFMVNSMSSEWGEYALFNVAWILVLATIVVMWFAKLRSVVDLAPNDRKQIWMVVAALGIQITIIAVSNFMSGDLSLIAQFLCLGSVFVGFAGLFASGLLHPGRCDFAFLVERCGILVILVLGELVIGIASAMRAGNEAAYCALLFLLAVSIFLVHFANATRIVETDAATTGLGYLALIIGEVTLISHCAISLHLIVEGGDGMRFGWLFLVLNLSAILLVTLANAVWNTKRSDLIVALVIQRLAACAVLGVSLLFANEHPILALFMDTVVLLLVREDTLRRFEAGKSEERDSSAPPTPSQPAGEER